MKAALYSPPASEPISLTELKLHLRLDSGTLADNLDSSQSIAPGNHGIHELMTLDVAPGGAGWAAGDTITGQTSAQTCIVVQVLTTKTYYVRNRSGTFTLGEILTNGTITADQGAANPTFATGYYLLGTGIDVLGYSAIVEFESGTNAATGTVDLKIQESDDNSTYTDWTGGAFTQVTTANDNATYEKAYTGIKRYIRVAAKILNAACEFGVSVIRNSGTAAEDDLLTAGITTARQHIENVTGRTLITQTWDYYLQNWPDKDYFLLPFGNLQSATVAYTDSDGNVTTMTVSTDYLVETNGEQCGRIVLPYGCTWPSETLYPSNPIAVRLICGWTAAANIPKPIITALKMVCADLYEMRGEPVLGQSVIENETVARLLASYKLRDEF